jgi:hypothetical protein
MKNREPLKDAAERCKELMETQGLTMLAAMRVQREEAIAYGVANGLLVTKAGRKK